MLPKSASFNPARKRWDVMCRGGGRYRWWYIHYCSNCSRRGFSGWFLVLNKFIILKIVGFSGVLSGIDGGVYETQVLSGHI